MTYSEAISIVMEAADRWATELVEYIIPAVTDDGEDKAGYQEQLERIQAALELLGMPR